MKCWVNVRFWQELCSKLHDGACALHYVGTFAQNRKRLSGQLNINDIIIEAKRTPITKSSDLKDLVDKIIKQGDKNLLLSIIDSNNRRRYIGIKLN